MTKQKVRKNAINGPRVKNNSLTGADINLNKLGTVPSASAADRATNAVNSANAGNADLLDGLDSSAFLGKEQLFVYRSDFIEGFVDHPLIVFPDLGFVLYTDGALQVGYAATESGNYEWSGYVNGGKIFTAVGPTEEGAVVTTVALELEAGVINRFEMVRQDPDGSNVGVATAECFVAPGSSKDIACLGHSASSG